MIINSNQQLQVFLNSTVALNQLPVYVNYVDIDTTNKAVSNNSNVLFTNGTTPVGMVATPTGDTRRTITSYIVRNTDTTNATVNIRVVQGANNYLINSFNLAVGETLQYSQTDGIEILTNTGARKQTLNQGVSPVSSSWNAVVLTSDVVNSANNVIQDVTGLSFPVNAGSTYAFRFAIPFTAGSVNNGSRWAMNGNVTFSYYSSTCTWSVNTNTTTTFNANGFDLPTTNSSPFAGSITGNVANLSGVISPTSNGIVSARFASANSGGNPIVAKAGAVLEWLQIS